MEKDKREILLDYIKNDLGLDDTEGVTSSTSLFESQRLDSMSLVDLIQHIETSFNTSIAPMDIIPENFDSVDTMVSLIERS